jgi:hypothetical protein
MSAMPEMKESDLQTLQEAFIEVAFRANRLREWTEIEKDLRKLDRSFSDFHDEVRKIETQPAAANMPLISDLWRRCSESDLVDLQASISGLRFINQSTWPGGDAGAQPGSLRVVDFSNLAQLVDAIEQAITDQALKQLTQQSNLFRKALNTQFADRQTRMRSEIQELCELTIRLKERLQR